MANIMDYLDWRGDLSLRVAPFNEVDNLILSQLIYLDFDGIVPGVDEKGVIRLREAAELYFEKYTEEQIEHLPRLKRNVSGLLTKLMTSMRFSKMELSDYVNDISIEEESQFSAMKIGLSDGSVFLSFSGTDTTVIGWKENFNMSFLSETPGQVKAVQYVEKTVPFYKNKLRFGGHSKGGNLAVYAAIHAKKSIQNRLLEVFNNDGPGFTERMVRADEYQNILSKIHTIIPQSSVVGMLLEHEEKMDVIESSNAGILQHDAFSWQVLGTSFIHLDILEEESIILAKTLKTWIYAMDEEQRKQFVEALFSILSKANIESTEQLQKMNFQRFMGLLKAMEGLSSENKEVLGKTLKLFVKVGSDIAIQAKRRKQGTKNQEERIEMKESASMS